MDTFDHGPFREAGMVELLTYKSCYWSARFMKVILLELSLVITTLQVLQYRCIVSGLQYKYAAVQLIQA